MKVHPKFDKAEKAKELMSAWGKGHVASAANDNLGKNLDRIREKVGVFSLASRKLFGGKDVRFGDVKEDLPLGQIYLLSRQARSYDCILSNNTVLGFMATIDMEYDVDLAVDVAGLYAAGYVIAASARRAPHHSGLSRDNEYWQTIFAEKGFSPNVVEPYRLAALLVELVYGDALAVEVIESQSTPLYVASLANPMQKREAELYAAQIEW